jgi:hypothetical protein
LQCELLTAEEKSEPFSSQLMLHAHQPQEDPQRCYILSVPDDESTASCALSCNRKGELWASPRRGRWEEWYLMAEDADAGVYRLVNAAHQLMLTCRRPADDGPMILSCQKVPASAEAWDDETVDAEDCWFLEPSTAPSGKWFGIGKMDAGGMLGRDCGDDNVVKLRSFTANAYLACGTGKDKKTQITIHSTGEQGKSNAVELPCADHLNWRLDFFTGELCYLQLASTPKLLFCDNLGRVKLSEAWGGWEVWRITEAGRDRVRISSWTHHTFFLACNPHGKVRTTSQRDNDETLWRIQKAPKGLEGVLITSVPYGRLLQSNGKSITTTGYVDGVATTWQLTAGHCQRYTISHVGYDRRLSLLKDGQLKTTRRRRDCEVWELEPMDHGFVLIRSNKWKRCLSHSAHDGLGISDETNPQHWDRSCLWRIVDAPTGTGFCIVSAMEPFLALSCNPKGELETVDHQGPWECWQLEPFMPASLQGWQINLMIGGAVGVALVGPALACCALGAAAAETTAVAAAGGVAVAETAAAAVAAGEVAATTSAAVGLGLAGTAAALGTGAAVGLSATGLVVAISSRRPRGTDVKRSSGEDNRPFCDWRSW